MAICRFRISCGSSASAVGPSSLVSGRGWLVRRGRSYVNSSREFPDAGTDGFVREWAPRTGAGRSSRV